MSQLFLDALLCLDLDLALNLQTGPYFPLSTQLVVDVFTHTFDGVGGLRFPVRCQPSLLFQVLSQLNDFGFLPHKLDDRQVQQCGGVWSVVGSDLQATGDDLAQLGRVACWYVWVAAGFDLLDEIEVRLGVEWRLLRAHLVYYAPKGPDIRVRAILLGLADLGRHVEGGADIGGGEVVRLQDLGEAKVTELDRVVVAQEDCGGGGVSM